MQKHPITKYRPFPKVDLPDRQWPDRTIEHAPVWCSVDLRDGNQALPQPMSVEEKLEMFDLLVGIGFKQIEVGFPSASQTEFDFMRRLIEEGRIPDGVAIQTLVQSREDLIARTFESIRGARNAIVHLYNSTSPLQRRVVFHHDKAETVALAVKGAQQIRTLADEWEAAGTRVQMEYSPESFSQTETAFAVEICEAVMDVWGPTRERPMILNLPATVEVATPNIHADQIEWFGRHVKDREKVLISLHTHNDRGTGVAATELGLMAGADRVEGTLFGNGERTGNLDLVTVALNLYTQGVDPGLDFSRLNDIRDTYERTTRMEVPPRQPYGGDLVFTAFSGSHQDAINKGMKAQRSQPDSALYEVPYLPIDPADLGRNYRAIIRINSQSGKGGVAWVLENEYGYQLPKAMHRELGVMVNRVADERGEELSADAIHELFLNEYLENKDPLEVISAESDTIEGGTRIAAEVVLSGQRRQISGEGNGPIDAFVHALREAGRGKFEFMSYSEHSLGRGAKANAACYIEIRTPQKASVFGAGIDSSIELASLKAVASAVNRAGV
ncbi:MAG: 2-isopropylmalate synthase [Verrucomicrobiota bacterium]